MASPASPAQTRAYIVERLVGDIGEPGHIVDTARALAARALPAIRQGFAESIAAPLDIEILSVELTRFSEARPEGAEHHAMTVASSPSSLDALILMMDPQSVALTVSALFGGDPDHTVAPIDRPLSPTELEVATMAFEEIAKGINGSGTRAFEFRMPLATAVSGIELAKQVIRDGPAVRVVFSLASNVSKGTMSLMMPQRVLLKHRSDSAPFVAGATAPAELAWRDRFNEEVMRSSVALEATMPLATMALGDLSGLHVGQLIEFEEKAQGQAKLSARHKTLFVCEFGKLGQNYTVRIKHPFDAGKELMEGLLPG